MNLCNDEHEEVCYEGRNCPACKERESRLETERDSEKEIERLNEKIDELRDQLTEAKAANE